MRLLVTRPAADAVATAERLTALGHTVTVEPLLRIVFSEPPADVPEPSEILATSRNGVRALSRWPQAAAWVEKPLLATGRMTAEEARGAGFRDVRAGNGDAAALGELVRRTLLRGRGPILYPAARNRAGGLAGGLIAQGYDVRVVEAYRADAAERLSGPVRAAFAASRIDGVLLYSRRTAMTFRALAFGLPLGATTLFAISGQVAEAVAGLGAPVRTASYPDEAHLFALIPPA